MNLKLGNLNWGAVSAVIALLGVITFDIVAPEPVSAHPKSKKSIDEYKKEVDATSKELEAEEAALQSLLWQSSRDEIGPVAMAWVSEQARAKFVDVRSFRPQKTVREGDVEQLNYLVTAEGTYPSVLEFLKVFESEESLLAVKLIQISSIDGSSDLVRASISIVAYLEVPKNG